MNPPSDTRDLEILADLLDSKFKGPFGFRFGWDGIVGLIPGLGDLATTLVSGYIVARAATLGASPSTLLRMLVNILIDNGVSAIPVLGWALDFAWKSNTKNLELIRAHRLDPARASQSSRRWVWVLVASVMVFALGLAAFSGWVAWKVFQFIAHL